MDQFQTLMLRKMVIYGNDQEPSFPIFFDRNAMRHVDSEKRGYYSSHYEWPRNTKRTMKRRGTQEDLMEPVNIPGMG